MAYINSLFVTSHSHSPLQYAIYCYPKTTQIPLPSLHFPPYIIALLFTSLARYTLLDIFICKLVASTIIPYDQIYLDSKSLPLCQVSLPLPPCCRVHRLRPRHTFLTALHCHIFRLRNHHNDGPDYQKGLGKSHPQGNERTSGRLGLQSCPVHSYCILAHDLFHSV